METIDRSVENIPVDIDGEDVYRVFGNCRWGEDSRGKLMTEGVVCSLCGAVIEGTTTSSSQSATCMTCGKEVDPLQSGTDLHVPEAKRASGVRIIASVFILVVLLGFSLLVAAGWLGQRHLTHGFDGACINNMRYIGIALNRYHDTYGRFPPPYTVDEDGNPLHSWRTLILPYMEENALYNRIHLDEPWDSEHNQKLASLEIPGYCCSSRSYFCFLRKEGEKRPPGQTDYVMITGPGTVGEGTEGTRLEDVIDPHNMTVIIAEVAQSNINWMEPRDYDFADGPHRLAARPKSPTGPTDLSSYHRGVVHMLMVDGSVESIPVDIDKGTFKALMTVRGGEEAGLE